MAKNEMEAVESLARTLNELDQNKLWIIAIVVIIVIVSYSMKWYLSWKSKQHSDNCLNKLSTSITTLSDTLIKHEASSNSRIEKLVGIMEEIRDRQKNVISKTDSIRIVLNKFNDVVKREVIAIFEWSLSNNNYENRSDFIRKKVKAALAEVIILTKESLNEFNLSIELDQFFITYNDEKSGNVHYKLIDQLWNNIEPLYYKDRYNGNNIIGQQIEEMQVEVNNVVTAELTKIQMEISNLY